MKAVKATAEKISQISAERIRQELEKIIVHPKRRRGLELLDESGLMQYVMPEVLAGKGVKQGRKLHPEGDVWQHTLLAMSRLENPSFEFALAVLLHDIGKAPTAGTDPQAMFPNHERVGEEMARNIAERLRLSNRETEVVSFLVRHHMILMEAPKMRKSTLKRILGHELFPQLAEMHRIDALASNGDLSNYNFVMQAKKRFREEELKPEPLVKGEDLMAAGIPAGPVLGKILRKLYTAQLDEEIKTRDEALALAKKLYEEEAAEPPCR